MKRNRIAIVLVMAYLTMAVLSSSGIVSAADPSLPRTSVSCDSDAGPPFTCAAAKDANAGTRWVSLNVPPYPHHITLTFGASYVVTSVALNQACLEYSGTGKVFAGSTEIGSWSGGTSANLTIAVTETTTASVEFRGLTFGGTAGYMCAVEVWAFGHALPPNPACAINDSLPGISSLLVIFLGVAILLLVVGVFLVMKRTKEGMDIRFYVSGIVGLIVVLIVAGVMTGALKGC